MSYILEALKKSDQQRQRGATPTLQAAQAAAAAPKRLLPVYYGLLAAVLLGAGVTIGWLRPWQAEQPPAETTVSGTEPIAAKPPTPIPQQVAPAPLTTLPEMHGKKAPEFPAANSTPAAQSALEVNAMQPDTGAAAHMPEKNMPEKNMHGKAIPEKPGSPAEERAIPMDELPFHIQQEIPAMAVQLHAYSNNPSESLVSINSVRLREGGSLTPGIRLEQITPDGMIFSYKGYRFQRGVR